MDEKELFAQYRATKDAALRNMIVERYLPVASMLAKKFVGRGVEYDDLFQVAVLAIMKGVDRFDETLGVKFTTFITPTIAGEIKNYFRDHSRIIRLPRRVAELRMNVKKTADRLFSETGRSATPAEIAEVLGVSEEEVLGAMEAEGVVSLDRPAEDEDGEGASYYDLLPAQDDAFERFERRDAVQSAVEKLSEREREIVSYRFGQGLSQSETARRMNVSQMYISRMERKILEKLKENLRKSLVE